jgi:hypothetical protein
MMTMRPTFAPLILFLLLGAIMNVLVAWGCLWALDVEATASSPCRRGQLTAIGLSEPHDDVEVDDEISVDRIRGTGFELLQLIWQPSTEPSRSALLELRIRAGVPSLALEGSMRADPTATDLWTKIWAGQDVYVSEGLASKLPLAWSLDSIRTSFPLRPLWPGFLFNTLFYATIVAGIFVATGRIRRTLRRRRGRCVTCGYDRRGNPSGGCPECWRV